MANNTLAYGFVGLENLFAERIDDANIAVVRDAIAQSVAEHNRQVTAILSELVSATEDYSARFKLSGGGTLQPLDEYGNPLPVREGGYYDVAFPIQGGGTAWGDNRITRALMTVEEVNEYTLGSLKRDADWMRRHILAALFDNVAWTYTDPDKGSLTIESLANGDAVTYIKNNGNQETDTHYLAQAAAVADATNPFDDIYAELMEHPSNAGADVVAYIPTNIISTVTGLANYVPISDPDVSLGANVSDIGGSLDRGFGDQVLGKTDKVWIVEWSQLPDDYILGVARGSKAPALKMRQYPAGELQGLFQEENSPDGNLQEHRFIRYAGFGAYNRVAALVYRVSNASYAIPTGYAAPLAV